MVPAPSMPGSSNLEVVRSTAAIRASATHRLAFAFTAVALVAAASSVALAQTAGAQDQLPRLTSPSPPRLFLLDNEPPPTARSRSELESWLSGADMKYIGCPGAATFARPESTSRNAPWVLHGKWQRETPFAVASLGFAGIRNSALPSSNALPLGGDVGQATLGSSAGLFLPATQWSVTAGLEKTLVKFSNGATVGVVTDLIVPVQTTSAVTGDPRLSGMKSAALRFGMVLRW